MYVIVAGLNRDLRMKAPAASLRISRYLGGRIRWGYERDHLIHVHSNVKTEKT